MSHVVSPLWIVKPQDPQKSAVLARAWGVSPLVAQIMMNRGIVDSENGSAFLRVGLEALHDPFALADMDRCVARLAAAVAAGEKIVVYGDYDVDGTTSAALLFDFFKALGVAIDVYIPDRLKEGYSLNTGALDRLKAQGMQIVVTVDNGIAALACARYAREIGLDLIITDHHELMEEMPLACAIVNPKRPDNRADFAGVAGVGVAFYLAMALRKHLRQAGYFSGGRREPNLSALLDLVAIGTVADVAPLTGQNRIFVKRGLAMIRKAVRPGVHALCEVSAIGVEKVDAGAIGFRLGPRINAGGRIGEPKDGFYLLTAETVEAARPYAMRLNSENERRRKLEERMLEEAQAIFESQSGYSERMACMVAKRDWNPGVVGIVASRLVEKYQRPALVFAWDGKVWKGSARSIPDFPIHSAIGACREHLIQFGGHPQAAGLSVAEETLPAFYQAFDDYAAAQLTPALCCKRLHIDMVLSEPLSLSHLDDMAALEPLGMLNPTPLFVHESVEVVSVKRLSEGKHLKLGLRLGKTTLDAISFRYPAARFDPVLAQKRPISLAFRPERNDWQGTSQLQLHIVDLK